MRGRDTDGDDGDERIINPDGEATERLKAVLDAEWGREESETDEQPEPETGVRAE
jgi:virulence-associated protein VagC